MEDNVSLRQLASKLADARKQKGLSQRALSEKLGIAQSRLSKIESGTVDIRVSSLFDLARALELEVVLTPRRALAAVEAITGSAERQQRSLAVRVSTKADEAYLELRRLERDVQRAIGQAGPAAEFVRLLDTIRDLARMPLNEAQAAHVRGIARSSGVRKFEPRSDHVRMFHEASVTNNALRDIRNAIAHGANAPPKGPQPAYRLNDGDEDG